MGGKKKSGLVPIAQALADDAEKREEVRTMVETYADVLLAEGERKGERNGERKGRIEQSREFILRLASKQLGPADASVEAALKDISDLERLARILERSFEAASWSDLLATP